MFTFNFVLELPEMLSPKTPGSRVNRHWNFAVKQAIRETLYDHWQTRIPMHFTPAARTLYDHRPRSPRYNKYKKSVGGQVTDIVKTGKTKRAMTRSMPVIRVGGNAVSSTVSGTMRLRWPKNDRKVGPKGLTRRNLNEEIQRFADGELPVVQRYFRDRFVYHLNRRLKSKRVRQRLGPQLSKLGIRP